MGIFWLLLTTLFPIALCFDYLYSRIHLPLHAHKLDSSVFSLALFREGFRWAAFFAKGALAFYIVDYYWGSTIMVLAAGILLMIGDLWNPLTGFKNQNLIFWSLWGAYAYISPSYLILWPVLFALSYVGFLSFPSAILCSILLSFFIFGFQNVGLIFLPLNFCFFVLIFIRYSKQIIQ